MAVAGLLKCRIVVEFHLDAVFNLLIVHLNELPQEHLVLGGTLSLDLLKAQLLYLLKVVSFAHSSLFCYGRGSEVGNGGSGIVGRAIEQSSNRTIEQSNNLTIDRNRSSILYPLSSILYPRSPSSIPHKITT